MNDVPEDWKTRHSGLAQEAFEALRLVDSYHAIDGLENDLQLKREAIASMLRSSMRKSLGYAPSALILQGFKTSCRSDEPTRR